MMGPLFINCRDNAVFLVVIYTNVVHKGASFQAKFNFGPRILTTMNICSWH
jgi:hypothetical protein